jgi:C-terminal processing protease CtpA/Prc
VGDLGPNGLETWVDSIKRAMQTGATFSDAFEYTRKDDCNSSDRVILRAPAIVVTSAMTFSAAEFFAACFQDHGGKILGVDETTGGGGAGVRTQKDLRNYFIRAGQEQQCPYIDLDAAANGAGFQVAFRRTKRVGLNAGKDIEDTGVQRNLSYSMTRDDLLYDNRDLKKEAIRLLMTP